jgi:hypothetical protein
MCYVGQLEEADAPVCNRHLAKRKSIKIDKHKVRSFSSMNERFGISATLYRAGNEVDIRQGS